MYNPVYDEHIKIQTAHLIGNFDWKLEHELHNFQLTMTNIFYSN